MIFLSLFLDLMLMLGGWGGSTLAAGAGGEVYQTHSVHGHVPGFPSEGTTHEHHGSHGHLETNPGAGHITH